MPIKSINNESIVVGSSGIEDGAVTNAKLAQSGGVLTDVESMMAVFKRVNLLPVDGVGSVSVLGLTATYNDGVLTVTGTSTGAGGRLNKLVAPFTLPAGTYTLSRSPDETTNIGVVIEDAATNSVLGSAINLYPATFTLSQGTSVYIGINIANNKTYNVSVQVQVEKGESATTFVRPSEMTIEDTAGRTIAETQYGNSLHKMDSNGGLTDANNAEINRIYLLIDVSSVSNLPTTKSGTLITIARHELAVLQLYCTVNRELYYRGNWGDHTNPSSWSAWKLFVDATMLDDAINSVQSVPSILSAFDNITCCGDSLTWGQVYTGASTSRRAYVGYPSALGKMTGASVEAHAVAGYTAEQWWDAFAGNITSKQNQLAIVFLGTNAGLTNTLSTDAPEGTDPTSWDTDTNTGAYASIVSKFKSVGAKVLLLRCFITSGTSASGSDLATTNAVINQIAERFGCAVVDAPNLTDNRYHYYPDGSGINTVHYNDLGYSAFASSLIGKTATLSDGVMKMLIPE